MKLQIVAFASFAALVPAVVVSVVGCANGKSTFLFSDGGAEGGTVKADGGKDDGGTSSGSTDCTSFCSSATDTGVGCDDTAKCASLCKADTKTASSAGCSDERDALLECATSGKKGVLVTCSSSKISISGCSAQQTALDDCIDGSGTTPTTKDAGPNPGSCTLTEAVATDPTCNSCAEQSCCAEWNTCFASSDCNAFYTCIDSCTQNDTACVQACANQHPSGYSLADTAITCTQNGCASPCNL